jgi:hypothetical protein
MIDDDLIGCLLFPIGRAADEPRASLKQWLLWLAGGILLVAVLYAIFSALGLSPA